MLPPTTCPQCRKPLPKNAPAGLCPACLATGLVTRNVVVRGGDTEVLPPTVSVTGVNRRLGQGGRFLLVKVLGRGGMGVVWQARDERLRQDVALKMLPAELRHEPAAMEGLRGETARNQRLAHPHILRIHDLHDEEGVAFFSMELVAGQDLEYLREHSPEGVLPWTRLGPLVWQLCEALAYAHGEGVIHRDLKPANLMVDARGRLKLADFGIAATVNTTLSQISLQHPRSGTPQYMSPQQLQGQTPGPTDDLYSVGAVLYHLLTGQPPFYQGDLPYQLACVPARPLAERQAEFSVYNPVPPPVAEAIMACLKKDPSERPQTAGDLLWRLGLANTPVAPPNVVVQPDGTKYYIASTLSARPGAATGPDGRETDAQRRLTQLLELPRLLTGDLAQPEVCAQVLDWVIAQIPGAMRGAFLIYDSQTGKLALRASRPESDPPISRTLVKKAAADGCGFIWDLGDAEFQASASMQKLAIASGMYVPLVWREKVMGVLFVDNPERAGLFQEEDLRYLTVVAHYAAAAIANAQLRAGLVT